MPWSEAWLAECLQANPDLRRLNPALELGVVVLPPVMASVVQAARPVRARRLDGYASGLEARYVREVLEPWKVSGRIIAWWYEGVKLRLASKAFYTPDFLVMSAMSAQLVLYEVKGFWRDDARLKIKVAAAQYPCFRFVAAQCIDDVWQEESF